MENTAAVATTQEDTATSTVAAAVPPAAGSSTSLHAGRPKRGRPPAQQQQQQLDATTTELIATVKIDSPPAKRTRSGVATRRSATDDKEQQQQDGENHPSEPKNGQHPRWLAHQLADDYVELASHLVLYPTAPSSSSAPLLFDAGNTNNSKTSCFPFEAVSALQYLKSPLRRPTVLETWSPLEVAMFEASIAEYGKNFHLAQKEIGTKTTKEIIDFYYIWKKTAHYERWKEQYIPPYLDVSDEDSDDVNHKNGNDKKKKAEPPNNSSAAITTGGGGVGGRR